MKTFAIAMDTAQPQLSIIVPAYQEEAGIGNALLAIANAIRSVGMPFELLVVDDGSRDDTWNVIAETSLVVPEIVAVRLSRNFGKEGAIAAGLDRACGDATIVLDADLQHPPTLIPEMVRLWRDEHWDVVEAVKSSRGTEPLAHRVAARAFYRLAARITGFELQDASDFKLLDRRVVDEWRRFSENVTFFRGLIPWLGFRRTRVFFAVPPRQTGPSRWSYVGLVGLAVHAVTSFSALPLQTVTLLGFVTLLVGGVFGVQALRLWYLGEALPGFTTVILLQLIIGGFLMISLGIIGCYIARIYDEVKGRPRYVVCETRGKGLEP